jgi:ribose 5-phosphate isomerase A
MADYENEKRLAAARSLDYVADGMSLGLGSGSTAEHVIRLLGERVAQGLQVRGVPTSARTRELAKQCGVPLTTLEDCAELDLTIDGADEVAPDLSLMKGGGGALLHEKIVASASRQMIVVTDSRKIVSQLGAFPLPVEVIPVACKLVAQRIARLGCSPKRRLSADGGPFVTEEGNAILDCPFGRIDDPQRLAAELDALPGVVEHGLFVGMASLVLVGRGASVQVIERV